MCPPKAVTLSGIRTGGAIETWLQSEPMETSPMILTSQRIFGQPNSTSDIGVRAPIGVFDLFKIGIGPSSSHTVGPMKAAAAFVAGLRERLAEVDRVRTTVFGSLAWTGKGHSSDKAIALGLCGLDPETLDPECSDATFKTIHVEGALNLGGRRHINYDPTTDIVFDKITHCDHPNTMWFEALDRTGCLLTKEVWLSLGGGFIVRQDDDSRLGDKSICAPFPFNSGTSHRYRLRNSERLRGLSPVGKSF